MKIIMTIMVVMGDGILQVLSAYRQLFLNSRALTEGGQVLSPSSPLGHGRPSAGMA